MGRSGRLFSLLRPYTFLFVANSVATLVASVMDGATFVLLIPFLRTLFGQQAIPVGGGSSVVRDLRVQLFEHLQVLPLGFFQRTRGGQLLARVISDTDQVKTTVTAALASLLQNVSLIVVYVAILVGLSWRLTLIALVCAPLLVLIIRPLVGKVLIFFVGTRWALGQAATLRPEVLIAFIAVALRLMSPAKSVANYPTAMAGALAAADRVYEVLDLEAVEGDRPGERPARFAERIEYRGVSFSYDGQAPVLRDVDVAVCRGQVAAIVGPSGAGKTTLVDLLPRFYDPTGGAIHMDGTPITRFTRRSLRALMGIVSQETILLNDTVFANIAYGRSDFSLAQVEGAARAGDRKSTRLNSSHGYISYAVFCLKKKKQKNIQYNATTTLQPGSQQRKTTVTVS